MHGMPGSPGAPGRDGRDGAKGDPAARERLDPRDHVVLTEIKEQRENLGSKVPPVKKDSEGTKVTVELLGCLHT